MPPTLMIHFIAIFPLSSMPQVAVWDFLYWFSSWDDVAIAFWCAVDARLFRLLRFFADTSFDAIISIFSCSHDDYFHLTFSCDVMFRCWCVFDADYFFIFSTLLLQWFRLFSTFSDYFSLIFWCHVMIISLSWFRNMIEAITWWHDVLMIFRASFSSISLSFLFFTKYFPSSHFDYFHFGFSMFSLSIFRRWLFSPMKYYAADVASFFFDYFDVDFGFSISGPCFRWFRHFSSLLILCAADDFRGVLWCGRFISMKLFSSHWYFKHWYFHFRFDAGSIA